VGMALERVVPKGGVELCGQRFEEGTIVGMNAWVVHRDRAVFGEDADEWNPDRWLGDAEQRVAMERCFLTVSLPRERKTKQVLVIFDSGMMLLLACLLINHGPTSVLSVLYEQFGAGHRTCLGKNISYLEMYKLIPTLLARYKVDDEPTPICFECERWLAGINYAG